jgi:hypothetical protein
MKMVGLCDKTKIAGLDVPELRRLLVTTRRSETDQDGEGVLGAAFGSNLDTCPVRALQALIALPDEASPDAPLFVSLNRHSQVVDRLCGKGVAKIVRRGSAAVGLAGRVTRCALDSSHRSRGGRRRARKPGTSRYD